MADKSELACVYAALILADDDVAITGEKMATLIKAANVDVEPYWPGLFAKALEGVNTKELVTRLGSGVGISAGGAVSSSSSAAVAEEAPAKEEEKKESEPEESDDDMGFGLFD